MTKAGRGEEWRVLQEAGNALFSRGDVDGAIVQYNASLRLKPSDAITHYNLGLALLRRRRSAEAAASLSKAVGLDRNRFQFHTALGVALQALGEPDRAAASYRAALALHPNDPETHSNLGTLARAAGRFDEALSHYDRALAIRPDYAEVHRNKGLLHLLLEEFDPGWAEYEWRWQCADFPGHGRRFVQPLWRGERRPGATLLVVGEQGIGDEILYGSMIGDVLASGMNVVLETDPRLVGPMQRAYPAARVIARERTPAAALQDPRIDWYSPAGNLGRYLRNELAAFPAKRGYLAADAQRSRAYREQLGLRAGERLVGVSWISKNPEIGGHKSSRLAEWRPILTVPGVRFVTLQYGDTGAERHAVQHELGIEIGQVPNLDLYRDLEGAAALTDACDLVITVSNSPAHLAGALGKSVWIMVPFATGNLWYWFRDRADSPWYPSATLLRQTTPQDWTPVLAQAGRNLTTL